MTEKLRITYIGHATLLIEIGPYAILTDPHFGRRLVHMKRVREPGLAFYELPKIDFILISHPHFDHLHIRTLKRFTHETTIIASESSAELFREKITCRLIEISEGETLAHGRLKISTEPAAHRKAARVYFGPPRETLSFVISLRDTTVYFAGDTAYGPHFKEIGQRRRIDVALLPIGPHKPRVHMKRKHLDPEGALKAFEDLNADFMIPYHWGTFKQVAFVGKNEARDELIGMVWERNLWDKVIILTHGESKEFA
jgi:L-ascorbate metabolism protein UlaG (beta-lactamase superfamily)